MIATWRTQSESAIRSSVTAKHLTALAYRPLVSGSRPMQRIEGLGASPRARIKPRAVRIDCRRFRGPKQCDPRSSPGCVGSHAPNFDSLARL